jgi:hypothetical protein
MLKKMALEMRAAMAFEKMRFARGDSRMSRGGMMGFGTRVSTQRKVGKQMAKMVREVMTTG